MISGKVRGGSGLIDKETVSRLPNVELGTLPVAVMQVLYHEITGKTETLSKSFKKPSKVTKNDIEQLSIKLHQVCGQFSVIGENCTYTVGHVNSMTQKFSSLEKFNQYDESIPFAIDNITVEFSALIEVPATKKHYQYKVEVVIELYELKNKDDIQIPDFILSFLDFESMRISIEYVDYVVARTFLATAEEWVEGLEKIHNNRFLVWLRSLLNPPNSFAPLRRGSDLIAYTVALYAAYQLRGAIIHAGDLTSLANFALIAVAITLFTTGTKTLCGAKPLFQSSLTIQEENVIVINRGDKENFENYQNAGKSALQAGVVYVLQLIIVICLNLFSNKIYDLIK